MSGVRLTHLCILSYLGAQFGWQIEKRKTWPEKGLDTRGLTPLEKTYVKPPDKLPRSAEGLTG